MSLEPESLHTVEEVKREYAISIRNLAPDTIGEIQNDPREYPDDSPLIRRAKALCRRLVQLTSGVILPARADASEIGHHPV